MTSTAMPIDTDKYIITVKNGKDLRRAKQGWLSSDSNLFCELTLGDEEPQYTAFRSSSNPVWDNSLEFRDPGAGLNKVLTIVCYSSLVASPSQSNLTDTAAPVAPTSGYIAGDKNSNSAGARPDGSDGGGGGGSDDVRSEASTIEVGRAEVTLEVAAGGAERMEVHLMRRSDDTRTIEPGGSIMLGIVHMQGVARDEIGPGWRPSDQECLHSSSSSGRTAAGTAVAYANGDNTRGVVSEAFGREAGGRAVGILKDPNLGIKWMALGAISAVLVGVAGRSWACSSSPAAVEPDLFPIRSPFDLAVRKHRGSDTHHVRLEDNGNIVVALGSRPCDGGAMFDGVCQPSRIMWQSGPLKDLDPVVGCKGCKVKVDANGRAGLWQGNQELAAFFPTRPGYDRYFRRYWIRASDIIMRLPRVFARAASAASRSNSKSETVPVSPYFADKAALAALKKEKLAEAKEKLAK